MIYMELLKVLLFIGIGEHKIDGINQIMCDLVGLANQNNPAKS